MNLTYDKLQDLERRLGDSWYILDLDRFVANYNDFLAAFRKYYPNTQIAYSYKTNYTPLLGKTVNELGGYAEVVSEMEYLLAIDIGVQPENIIVNGPYKPYRALELYLESGSVVVLDSYQEYKDTIQIAKSNHGKPLRVGLRCNFPLSGYPNSRFGFDINNPKFYDIARELSLNNNIVLEGIHSHFPYRDVNTFYERVERMFEVYDNVSEFCDLKFIDMGSGLGGRTSDELVKLLGIKKVDYQDYADVVAHQFQKRFGAGEQAPQLIMEPGTALVADTMSYICKVIEIKKVGDSNIAITSGSKVNYHSRTSKLNMPIQVYSDGHQASDHLDSADISGYTCMEEDYIYRAYQGNLKIGDYIRVDNVGSYSIVFKPPFINPNVPIIAYSKGSYDVIKEAEDFEYVFQLYKRKTK